VRWLEAGKYQSRRKLDHIPLLWFCTCATVAELDTDKKVHEWQST
jgi:hypothetical protein